MAKLKSPFHGAVVTVPDDAVKRYTDNGWQTVEDEPKPRGRPKKNS